VAWSNKGVALYELKRYQEAIADYDKAISLKPEIDWIPGDLLHTKMKMCAWSGLAESLQGISKKVIANEKVANPFLLIALNDDTFLHKKSSEIYVEEKFPKKLTLGLIHKYPLKDKIRIGYFSADFRNHPVSFLTSELFELHDKNKFEIIAFSFGADDKSPMRSRLSQAFNQFIDVSSMSDLNIAKLSRDLNIDIAVDLGGHTAGGRTGIFSYLVAPIQLSYIGYLGTMGAEYFDYLIADETILPEELQKFYSEKIIYLPSYQVNDRKRPISDKRYTRSDLGIPEAGFIFCCFNNNYKILPDTFDCWMRILRNVEGSILFLYAENKWAEENLCKHAQSRGIDSARLIFGGHLPNDEYLARYRLCDLFLDTFPYNAGTTASDALWAGVPIVTLMGRSFASRVAASLLNAIGLPELVTNTQEGYEALAIELAMNPKTLTEIKLKLAANRLTAPLFDTPLFTKNLEAAYIKMYERYQAGLKPDHIFIA
jgi:predicted O-linked N-acetylglucosamine transferase (SPINDLY family)